MSDKERYTKKLNMDAVTGYYGKIGYGMKIFHIGMNSYQIGINSFQAFLADDDPLCV